MAIHRLKTLSPYFQDIKSGNKTFEVRKNDRDFQINDALYLIEILNDGTETGDYILCSCIYILYGGQYGIKEGYVVMGIMGVMEKCERYDTNNYL